MQLFDFLVRRPFKCGLYYRKRGSASYIVREVLSVRERERYRERRKWRHHCRAKIGDEFTLSLAKNSHKWRRIYTFPCQKFALFVSPFTLPVSPFLNGHYCGAEIRNEFTLPLPKNLSLLVRNLSNGASRATSDRKLKTNDQILPSPTLFFPSKNWIKLIPKTIGNRKRDCAWGCAWGINTTWENLQIEKHKSVRWAERTPSWFVLFDLQIFSGGVYSPSATSRTISFSISNSFWY